MRIVGVSIAGLNRISFRFRFGEHLIMSQPLRLVVADDDNAMAHYYGRMVPHWGHVLVAVVSNGRELVESCLQLRPDLVVSDIEMPELDGISAMERVQCEIDIPFIFVSGNDREKHLKRLRRGHVLDFLQKPVDQSEFSFALRNASAARAAS